jgi:hypothetical protein
MGSNGSASDVRLDYPYDSPPSGMTRRSFLTAVNALALVAILEACTGKHHPAAATTSATGSGSATAAASSAVASSAAAADFLAVLRQAVQASPDFLQAAAAKAVASKDIATIAAFVRDRISVVPPWAEGDQPASSKRWGARATLRGGSGSLRDRADLLAELLTAAGFTASVMSADLPSAIDLPTLYQVRAADFEPDEKLYAQAVALLPAGTVLPATAAPSSTGPAQSPAQVAAKALAAVIPTALQSATIRQDLLPASVPVVVVGTTPGASPSPSAAQQYLFVLGDLAPSATAPSGLSSAAESPTPNVSVTVSGLTNPAPGSATASGQFVQLVSGSWPAEQVFGRQVLLSFVPPSGPTGYLTGAPIDQPIRVPFLRVQSELAAYAAPPIAASSPPASTTSLASGASGETIAVFNGAPITLQGDVLSEPTGSSSDAQVAQGAYGPMTTLSTAQRKTAIASAATIQATARATTFPEIELDVAVLDSAGNSVNGLDATAFSITDNATVAPSISLMSNAAGPNKPRVLVIYDTTGSVEETWPSAAAKATFEQSLATTLVAAAGETPFDVQVLGLDAAVDPDPTKWVPPDQAGLRTALANAGGNDSVVWGAASGGGIDQGVVAMLMVSDFQSGGESPAQIAGAQRRIGAAHIPVICLTIGKPDAAAVSTMVTLSGGTQLDPLASTTSSALAALIKPLVAARTLSAYRMRYVAPTGGPTTHTVTVTLAGRKTPVATATYTAPATPATPWSFAGLYVRISVADYDTGVRHLAGINLDGNSLVEALDDAAATAATRAAIYGLTTIAIEPGTVTTAAILDDVISSVQSVQPVLALTKSATPQDALAAAAKSGGVRRVPPVLISLLRAPVASSNPSAVPTMQVAILQERIDALGGLDTRMDMPPAVNTVEPLGVDPVAAFGAGLALSSNAAAAEAANFDSSAFSSLVGRPLTFLPASDVGPWNTFVSGLPAAAQPAWQAVLNTTFYTSTLHAVVPTGATTAAFWVVDTKTGAVTAVLLDGSGGALSADGGTECAPHVASEAEEWIDTLNLVLALLTSACIGLGGFFCLGSESGVIFAAAGIVLAIVGGAELGGSFTGVASLGSLFVAIASTNPYVKIAKIIAVLGFAALGALPDPCGPVQAVPAGQGDTSGNGSGGGQSDQPAPACGVNGSDDGSC